MESYNRQQNKQNEENTSKFKDDLYKQYADTGIVDNMKAQLRYKLVAKLQKSAPLQQSQVLNVPEDQSLKKRIMASLVVDYMDKEQHSYSKSVFLPECGYQNSTLSKMEMMDIMHATDIFTDHKASLLSNILDMMLGPETDKKKKRVYKTNSCTQTDHGDSIMNLENKLNMVDFEWKQKIQAELIPNASTIEERMDRFKKEYEIRMKADMQAELTRIRNFEIANIRLEEGEKFASEMAEYREDLEKKYQEKLQKLRDREKQTLDRCSQKMKDLESYNHDHRQKILKDFELLKLREDGVEKQEKLNQERLALEKAKFETLQKDLKNKMKDAEEKTFYQEKHQENEKAMAKLEVYKQVQGEQLEFIEKKKVLDAELFKIESLRENLQQQKQQNKQLTEQNSQYVQRLEELTKKQKEYDMDVKQLRDTNQNINESYRREQGNIKNNNEMLRVKQDEIDFLKKALQDKDELVTQQRQNQIQQMKKLNNEIHDYQIQIEKLENQIKVFRQQNQENEEIIQKGIEQPLSYNIQQQQPVQQQQQSYKQQQSYESLGQSKLNQSYLNKKQSLELELQKNREERHKVLQEFMAENEMIDKRGYNAKFTNVWDLHSSNVEFSQMPSISKKEIEKRDQVKEMNQDYQIQDKQQQYSQNYLESNNNQQKQLNIQQQQQQYTADNKSGLLDRVDVAQSMSYDKSPNGMNIIEQASQQYKQQQQQQQKDSLFQQQSKRDASLKAEEDKQQQNQQQQPKQYSRGKKIFQDVEQYSRNLQEDNNNNQENQNYPKQLSSIKEQKSTEKQSPFTKHHVTSNSPEKQQNKNDYYNVDEDDFLGKKNKTEDPFKKKQNTKDNDDEDLYKPSNYQSSQFPPVGGIGGSSKSSLPSLAKNPIQQQQKQQQQSGFDYGVELSDDQESQKNKKPSDEYSDDFHNNNSSAKKKSEGNDYSEEFFEEIAEDIEDDYL